MGSNIDALIAGGIRPPQIEDPQTVAMRAMQMRSLAAEQQMQPIRMQTMQLGLQQEQRALQDDQITRQAYMDSAGDLDKTEQLIMQRGGSPKAVQDLRMQRLNIRKTMAQTDETELKNTADRHNQLRGQADAFLDQPDNVKQQQYIPFLQQQLKNGNLTQQEYGQMISAHPTYPGDDQWKIYTNGLRTGTQAAEEELKNRKDLREQVPFRKGQAVQEASALEIDPKTGMPADMNKYGQVAGKYPEYLPPPSQLRPGDIQRFSLSTVPVAEQPKVQMDTAKYQAMLKYLQNPQQIFSDLDAILPPQRYPEANAANRALLQSAIGRGDFDKITQIQSSAKDFADSIAKETDPKVLAAKLNEHVAQARATIAMQQAQYAGSPFEHVSPKFLPTALGEAKKASDDYINAVSSANEMQDFIDSARNGNKVANAYAPTTGVLAINTANGTKRVNKAEIESYGGAGSLWDSIQGRLGKLATGQSIPKDILDDMEKLHAGMAGNAQKTYDNHRATMKQLYNADIPPAQLPNPPRNVPTGGAYLRTTTNQAGHKIGQKADGRWYDFQTGKPI